MFIYNLDNENGGMILSDSDTTAPALQVNSNAAGYPAIAAYSTASTSVIKVTALSGAGLQVTASGGPGVDVDASGTQIGIDADSSSTTAGAGDFRSSASIGPALVVGRTVNGSPTVGALQFLGTSVASGAILGFKGGFISLTSIILTTAAHFDYALPVEVNGVQRYIPLVAATGISGAAAF